MVYHSEQDNRTAKASRLVCTNTVYTMKICWATLNNDEEGEEASCGPVVQMELEVRAKRTSKARMLKPGRQRDAHRNMIACCVLWSIGLDSCPGGLRDASCS